MAISWATQMGSIRTEGFMSIPPPAQAVATDFQNESAAALAAAATRHLQEAEQTKDSGAEHW